MFDNISTDNLLLLFSFINLFRSNFYNFNDMQRALYLELLDRGKILEKGVDFNG